MGKVNKKDWGAITAECRVWLLMEPRSGGKVKVTERKRHFQGTRRTLDCIIDEILKLLGFKRGSIVLFCKRCVALRKHKKPYLDWNTTLTVITQVIGEKGMPVWVQVYAYISTYIYNVVSHELVRLCGIMCPSFNIYMRQILKKKKKKKEEKKVF